MSEEKEMSFLDHLEELRWHIVRSITAIMICMMVAFFFTKWIFQHIIFAPTNVDFITFQWLCDLGNLTGAVDALCAKPFPFKIQSRYMTGQFTMQVLSAFVIGFIVSFPYVFWEIWRFVKPGLRLSERKIPAVRYSLFPSYSYSVFHLGILFSVP